MSEKYERILYTYANIEELRRYESQLEEKGALLYSYIIAEDLKLFDDSANIVIDITNVVLFLNSTAGNRLNVEILFNKLDIDSTLIIQEQYASIAIEMFPHIIHKNKPLFTKKDDDIKIPELNRMCLYSYANNIQLSEIINYASSHEIPIASFPNANGHLRACFDEFNNSNKMSIIDLTSLSLAIKDNKNIIYIAEQFFGLFTNIIYIANTKNVDSLLEDFPLCFDRCEVVTHLIKEMKSKDEKRYDNRKRCITDLTKTEFKSFCEFLNNNLIGHKIFKQRLYKTLNSFRTLNKMSDQKVLSLFLFGASGIGKTEVARLVAEQLHKDAYLTKINFANYSDQNALNILIGSPPGYVGCDHGELSEKVEKSQIGLILCDEFEKTNRSVFSFFLEMLEDGKFTDTMAREFDINGYIIIFTSNIQTEKEYKEKIPSELQTRFDIVCEFKEPSVEDKKDFLNLMFERAKGKYSKVFGEQIIKEEDKYLLFDFDYRHMNALRDIKREFQHRLIELIEKNKPEI